MHYRRDCYDLTLYAIDDSITVNEPLTKPSSVISGTTRPENGKREKLLVVLRIVFTTAAAYAGESPRCIEQWPQDLRQPELNKTSTSSFAVLIMLENLAQKRFTKHWFNCNPRVC